jgi:glutathione gamma-glutamylcysteinyltransferase
MTFYKRELPRNLIAFSSPKGKSHLKQALVQGGLENYFNLAEYFTT